VGGAARDREAGDARDDADDSEASQDRAADQEPSLRVLLGFAGVPGLVLADLGRALAQGVFLFRGVDGRGRRGRRGRLLGRATRDRDFTKDLLGLVDLVAVLLGVAVLEEVAQIVVGLVAVAGLPGRDADLVGEAVLARDQVVGLFVALDGLDPIALGGEALGLDVDGLGPLFLLVVAQVFSGSRFGSG